MAQNITDSLFLAAAKNLDDKTGVLKSGVWSPYDNVAEFLARFSNVNSRAEGQFFWVRSTIDANKADLYTIAKNKTAYKVQADVDLSAYSTTAQMNTAISNAVTPIEEGLSSTNEVLMEEIQDRQDGDEANALAISTEVVRATASETNLQSQLNDKANLADVSSPIDIDYNDLVDNTYTNPDFSDKTALIIHYSPNGLQKDNLVFVGDTTVLPFTADPDFTGTIIGDTSSAIQPIFFYINEDMELIYVRKYRYDFTPHINNNNELIITQ